MKPKVATYQLVIRIPAELAAALRARAEFDDRPLARVVRAALREYLEKPGGTS